MNISALGYVVVETTDIEKWRFFGTQVIGMAASDGPGGSLYLKMDQRQYRLLIVPGSRDGFRAAGWEMQDEQAFTLGRERLAAAGVEVTPATAEELALRKVWGMYSFADPSGNRQEVSWGPISDFSRFVSPVGVESFVTGNMGMGHVVLPAMKFDETHRFWNEVGGFGLSDILRVAFGPQHSMRIHFMHCNPRQHSLALAEMPSPSGCVHIMVEVPNIDEVGRALDRIARHKVPLAATLGRHVNDDMVSFYVWTPGGFALEFGCGGLVKDWQNDHTVFETTVGSHWGHQWSPPPAAKPA